MLSDNENCFQDSSGIFCDNDSLATLLALELKADLLVLLSDVEGLYNAPPNKPHAELIHTYVKEKHEGEITFGDKSKVGRGGMTAKVKAANQAADAGTPTVITRYSCIQFLLHHTEQSEFGVRDAFYFHSIQCLQTLDIGQLVEGIGLCVSCSVWMARFNHVVKCVMVKHGNWVQIWKKETRINPNEGRVLL